MTRVISALPLVEMKKTASNLVSLSEYLAMKWRHGFQEVGDDEPKALRDLGLTRLVTNWLLGALVDLADVARSQRVGEVGCCLGNVPCGLHGTLVWMS